MISRAIVRIAFILICLLASSAGLRAQNAVPYVYQPLVPAAAAPGGAAFTLTVNGTGFVSGATVKWNGAARVTTFVNSTQLTAAILASDITSARSAGITVVNPTPGGGTSNTVLFSVTQPTKGVVFSSSQIPNVVNNEAWDYEGHPIAADFNNDGNTDLAVLDPTGGLSVLLGNGDGTFQPPVSYTFLQPQNRYPLGITVGDFDGDGKLDIALTLQAAEVDIPQPAMNGVTVLLGNGDGTFRSPVRSAQAMGGVVLHSLRVADLSRDGKLDIVGLCGGSLCILQGNGDGTFSSGNIYPFYSAISSFTIGDFNGDGKLDIVANAAPAYLVLFPGNGDRTFESPSIIFNSYAHNPGGVASADFDGDGKLDLVYFHDECANNGSGPCEGNLNFLLGNGDGTFQSPLTLPGLPDPGEAISPLVGDFNGDGKVDVAFGENLLLLGTLGSTFSYSLLPVPTDINEHNAIGFFNGNGKLGLVGVPRPGSGSLIAGNLNLITQIAPTVDFVPSASPSYQTIVNGGSASFTIAISAIDGFNGTILPTVTGLPAGATASFSPATVTGSGTTVLTISTSSSTPTGGYALNITLTSGSLSHGGGLTLNVGPSGTDFTDFTGTLTPTYANVTPGGSAGYGIQIQPINGFNGNVSLSVSGLPVGSSASFSSAIVTGGAGGSILTVNSAASTPTGTYQFTLTATSGSHTHSTTLTLNVGPSGTNFGDFTGTITPDSQTVTAGSSTTYTISIQPLNGYSGSVHVTLDSQDPNSGIGARGIQDIPTPGSTTITVNTFIHTPPGTYNLVFRVTGSNSFGPVQHARGVTLIVTP